MKLPTFLLYGANGYTAKLILRFASEFGVKPFLAGRNELKIKPLAEEFGCEYRIFDLSEKEKLDAALRETPVVLHCAGPFMFTARPMMEACLRTGTHYLDITGEIAVFEMASRFSEKAKAAGVMFMPGTGFDVVPTDCTALYLKKQLPNATHLRLAFASIGGSTSHGTAMTMVENLGQSGAVRQDGKITRVPVGHKTWTSAPADPRRPIFTMCIPWGDVSTAWHTTGIPNIETYMAVPPSMHRKLRWSRWFNWLLRTEFVKNIARKRVNARPAGPGDEARQKGKTLVWGEVRNERGDKKGVLLTVPEGYTLTAKTSLAIVKKVLGGDFKAGFQTPAGLYGENLVFEAGEKIERRDL